MIWDFIACSKSGLSNILGKHSVRLQKKKKKQQQIRKLVNVACWWLVTSYDYHKQKGSDFFQSVIWLAYGKWFQKKSLMLQGSRVAQQKIVCPVFGSALSQPSMAESQGSKALWVGRMIYSPVSHSNTSQLWMFVWSCMWKRVDSSECVCVMLACDAAVWQDAVHWLHVLRRKQVLVFPLSVGSYRMMGRPGLWVGIGRCLNWREK